MAYDLRISSRARDDLAKLDKAILVSVRKRLNRLVETADQIRHLPLKGSFGYTSKVWELESICSADRVRRYQILPFVAADFIRR